MTTIETAGALPMPGMDMVGRGVYLRPRQTFELKDILFKQANGQSYHSKETGETYWVPLGYEVNDSPPMPAARALNQVMIEESWDRFESQTSLDVGLTVSDAPFSMDVNAGQTGQLRSEEEAYYALRNSFIPLWSIYLADADGVDQDALSGDIPAPYRPECRRVYERFFERHGTHYVKRVWVGGKASLAFTIAKSSQMTKEEIKAGIKASQMGLGTATANSEARSSKEKLQNNSECTVFGKGGDELKLAALSALDETLYNEWLATVKNNPQVIEFDACGIWTLIPDQAKADALRQAYAESTVFTPLRVAFNHGRRLHVFRGEEYFHYDLEKGETSPVSRIRERWPMLSQHGFEQVDAAFLGKYLTSSKGEDLSDKLYLFNRDRYLRLDMKTREIDPDYPKAIAEGWPGVSFERIDAALNVAPDALYFFRGDRYIRFNMLNNRADEGYPESVPKRWAGITFDRIDAAVYWGNAKVYFFRGDQHIRYDMVNYRADPGYPKFIVGNYVEDWKFFD
jgi:hypothetical protein